MANDRMYLRCRACGSTMYLGKSFLGGFYYENYHKDAGPLDRQLNDFYDKHTYCDCSASETCRMNENNTAPDGCFEIVYEMSDWEPPCNKAGEAEPKEDT